MKKLILILGISLGLATTIYANDKVEIFGLNLEQTPSEAWNHLEGLGLRCEQINGLEFFKCFGTVIEKFSKDKEEVEWPLVEVMSTGEKINFITIGCAAFDVCKESAYIISKLLSLSGIVPDNFESGLHNREIRRSRIIRNGKTEQSIQGMTLGGTATVSFADNKAYLTKHIRVGNTGVYVGPIYSSYIRDEDAWKWGNSIRLWRIPSPDNRDFSAKSWSTPEIYFPDKD